MELCPHVGHWCRGAVPEHITHFRTCEKLLTFSSPHATARWKLINSSWPPDPKVTVTLKMWSVRRYSLKQNDRNTEHTSDFPCRLIWFTLSWGRRGTRVICWFSMLQFSPVSSTFLPLTSQTCQSLRGYTIKESHYKGCSLTQVNYYAWKHKLFQDAHGYLFQVHLLFQPFVANRPTFLRHVAVINLKM